MPEGANVHKCHSEKLRPCNNTSGRVVGTRSANMETRPSDLIVCCHATLVSSSPSREFIMTKNRSFKKIPQGESLLKAQKRMGKEIKDTNPS
jgi:hypothetical protein